MLSMSFKPELRSVRKESTSLAVAVNWYKVRVNNLEKKVTENELYGIVLLRELMRSRQEV